jgi:beta-aspartyl-peptidase (threonine type)
VYAIVVHGGAGRFDAGREAALLEGVRTACERGRGLLGDGATAIDAVVEAARLLEDDPLFNAGTGSVLNLDGEVEMDASVMVGDGLRAGAVAGLRRVQNPVLVARQVMELTDHVLLAGRGALRFARAVGFADHDPVTPQRRADFEARLRLLEAKHGEERLAVLHALLAEQDHGTVGVCARDRHGGLAAATSTGGMTLKLPGRIGDSPIPGAGNYATPEAACSATGRGELMLRHLTAKVVCDAVAAGRPADTAVAEVIERMRKGGGAELGLIAVDADGWIGIAHGTEAMPHAYATERQPAVIAALRR